MDARRAFWTLTAWENKAAMLAYRNVHAHKAAMPRLQHWRDEASVANWELEDAASMPTWPEAGHRMIEEGRKSKVRNPSADHEAGIIAPPRWPNKMVRPLTPKA